MFTETSFSFAESLFDGSKSIKSLEDLVKYPEDHKKLVGLVMRETENNMDLWDFIGSNNCEDSPQLLSNALIDCDEEKTKAFFDGMANGALYLASSNIEFLFDRLISTEKLGEDE